MHTHACTCQLAECRPWRLFCSMTCTGTEMTKIPFITVSLCVSPSHFSLYVPPCHCVHLHFFHPDYQNGLFWNSVSLCSCHCHFTRLARVFSFAPYFFFLDVTALYSPFHSRIVPVSPPYSVLCNIRAKIPTTKRSPFTQTL